MPNSAKTIATAHANEHIKGCFRDGTAGSLQYSPQSAAPRRASADLVAERCDAAIRPELGEKRNRPIFCERSNRATALSTLIHVHRLLPFLVGQWPRLNNAAPSLRPHYRAFPTNTG